MHIQEQNTVTDAVLITRANRVVLLADLNLRAFERLARLEANLPRHNLDAMAPDRQQAALDEWSERFAALEEAPRMRAATSVYDRTAERLEAAVAELSAMRAESLAGTVAEARAAEVARVGREDVEFVVGLDRSIAVDVRILARLAA